MSILLEKAFDVLEHVNKHRETGNVDYDFIKKDGSKISLDAKGQMSLIDKSIQAFMTGGFEGLAARAKKIQAFGTSADVPKLDKDVFNVTQQVDYFDNFWAEAFRPVTLMKGQLEWNVATVGTGIKYEKVPEGGKIKYEKYSGSKITVGVEKYGAALGTTWEMIEGRKLYQFIDKAEAERVERANLYADIHYGLLRAAATANTANDVAWQGVGTDATILRDRLTMNLGSYEIGNTNKDKGYGNVLMQPAILYYDPILEERLTAAQRVSTDALAAGGAQNIKAVGSRVRPIILRPSFNSSIAGASKGLLVIPGWKIQNAIYMFMLMLEKRDIETLTWLQTHWTAFGATVADIEQVVELSFS